MFKLNNYNKTISGSRNGPDGLPVDCDGWMVKGINSPCKNCGCNNCSAKVETNIYEKVPQVTIKKLREKISKNN